MENKTIIFFYKNPTFVVKNKKIFFCLILTNLFIMQLKLKNLFFNTFLNYIFFYQFINTNFINKFLYLWNGIFIKKFLILGKGFKLKKKKINSTWKFNRSHFKKLWLNKSILQKINKKKFLFIFKTTSILFLQNFICKLYKRNIFLKKLIKLSRNFLLLKKKRK